jgi:hypothetical protein
MWVRRHMDVYHYYDPEEPLTQSEKIYQPLVLQYSTNILTTNGRSQIDDNQPIPG